jgi:hypothetical protein
MLTTLQVVLRVSLQVMLRDGSCVDFSSLYPTPLAVLSTNGCY